MNKTLASLIMASVVGISSTAFAQTAPGNITINLPPGGGTIPTNITIPPGSTLTITGAELPFGAGSNTVIMPGTNNTISHGPTFPTTFNSNSPGPVITVVNNNPTPTFLVTGTDTLPIPRQQFISQVVGDFGGGGAKSSSIPVSISANFLANRNPSNMPSTIASNKTVAGLAGLSPSSGTSAQDIAFVNLGSNDEHLPVQSWVVQP